MVNKWTNKMILALIWNNYKEYGPNRYSNMVCSIWIKLLFPYGISHNEIQIGTTWSTLALMLRETQ